MATKTLLLILFLLMVSVAYAITDGCGYEVDLNTACVVRTPPITCNTYSIYNTTGNLTNADSVMQEVRLGSGVYNFTFVGNALGVYSIVLCDNTSTQINVEITNEADLATIIEGIQTNATDIKINVTESVWTYPGNIVNNILSQIIDFLFGSITTTDGKTFNESIGQIDTINETTYYIEMLV